MGKLLDALRRKYRTPQEAVHALGLDAELLEHEAKELAMDSILSPKALFAKGALQAYLTPRLALDAKIALDPILEHVTSGNFRSRRPIIATAIRMATRGRLAQDASLEDLDEVLEGIERQRPEAWDAANAGLPMGIRRHSEDEADDEADDERKRREADDKRAEDAKKRLGRDATAIAERDQQHREATAAANFGRDESEEEREEREEEESKKEARDRLGRDETEEECEEREAQDRHARDVRRAYDRFRRADDRLRKHREADDAKRADDRHKAEDRRRAADRRHALDALRRARAEDRKHRAEDRKDADDKRADDRRRDADDKRADDKRDADDRRADDKRRDADDRKRADDRRRDADDDDKRADDKRRADDRRRAEDNPPPYAGMPEPGGTMVTKEAMDAAIATAIAERDQQHREATAAANFVRPWVGTLALAYDSAEDVYKAALEIRGVKTAGIHPSAYRAILENLPKPGASPAASTSAARSYASDAAPAGKSFAEMFPESRRIHVQH